MGQLPWKAENGPKGRRNLGLLGNCNGGGDLNSDASTGMSLLQSETLNIKPGHTFRFQPVAMPLFTNLFCVQQESFAATFHVLIWTYSALVLAVSTFV
jgi:hypothetical protein